MDVHSLPLKAFGLWWRKSTDTRNLCRQVDGVRALGLRAPVPLPNLPTLVVFEGVNDPDSVTVVQPTGLSAALGPGHALEDVWLEITSDRPTDTGMARFPWWHRKIAEWEDDRVRGVGKSLIHNLSAAAFKRPGIWSSEQ